MEKVKAELFKTKAASEIVKLVILLMGCIAVATVEGFLNERTTLWITAMALIGAAAVARVGLNAVISLETEIERLERMERYIKKVRRLVIQEVEETERRANKGEGEQEDA